MSREPFTRRARIKAKSPEEFERWRELADRARDKQRRSKVKDDRSSPTAKEVKK